MKNKSAEENRRSKNDVITIDDDDSPSGQSESGPPPTVAQVQQQLTEEKERSKSAIRIAGEYKERLQFLENLIDTKRDVKGNAVKEAEELRKRFEKIGKQFDEEKKDWEAKATADREEKEHLSLMLDKEMKRGENEREREEKRAADDKQRYEDLLSIEKRRAAAKANADKEQLDLISAQLDAEKKKVEAKDAQMMALKGENALLKEEVAVVKRENGQLKCDLNKSKDTESRSQTEIDNLKRKLMESEDVKSIVNPPPTSPIPPCQSDHPNSGDSVDNVSMVPNFTKPVPPENKEESTESSAEVPAENQSPAQDSIGDEREMREGEILNEDNSGMDNAEVDNSLNGPPFNDDESANRTMQPSDFMNYFMNLNDEISGDREATPMENNLLDDMRSMDGMDQSEMNHYTIEEEDDENESTGDKTTVTPKPPSRNVSRSVQYAGMDDSEGDEPLMKKSRSDSEKGNGEKPSFKGSSKLDSKTKKRGPAKRSDTDIECPECEFRTRNVNSWGIHIKAKHNTTPYLAGFALLCECGNEGYSENHSITCDISNFTVIRKKNGPVERLDDEKKTPQCILCEVYPRTANGYMQHLGRHHKTNLKANGIYLKCACDFIVTNRCPATLKKHDNKCDGRQFYLHKLDEE